jgi:ATP-binding cassette subfamily F protein 3
VAAGKPVDRREQKARQNRLRKIENEMARLTQTCASIEQRLGDASIYDEANRDELNRQLDEQAQASARLAQVEEEWLELSEAIEAQGK